MRERNQSNVVPGACVYGSPWISQPPMQPSNSPNGFSGVAAPRLGESYAHADIFESFSASHIPPASSITTSAPASHSTLAAIPPPAPEPTIQTSYVFGCRITCITGKSVLHLASGFRGLPRRTLRTRRFNPEQNRIVPPVLRVLRGETADRVI